MKLERILLLFSFLPLLCMGRDVYVDQDTGSDESGGFSPENPMQTLSAAVSVASSGDSIVLMSEVFYSASSILLANKSLDFAVWGNQSHHVTVRCLSTISTPLFDVTASV